MGEEESVEDTGMNLSVANIDYEEPQTAYYYLDIYSPGKVVSTNCSRCGIKNECGIASALLGAGLCLQFNL